MAQKSKFYLQSGKTISDLKSLAKMLVTMPKEVYDHHVNDQKNDFAAWTKLSLGKESLAKKIDGQISKIELELEVLRHIVHEVEKKNPKPKKKAKVVKKAPPKKQTVAKKVPVKKAQTKTVKKTKK